MTKPWNGLQDLTRPIPAASVTGPLIDTFYRKRMGLWIVWSLLPPDENDFYRTVILLGAFKNRAHARFAADTAYVACRSDSTFLPMMRELLVEADDFLDVLHAVSHYADSAPWICHHRVTEKVFSPLSGSDVEALTCQIENNNRIQDWRFVWAGTGAARLPTLIRIKNRMPVAAFVLGRDIFRTGSISVWLDDKAHDVPCHPLVLDENLLSNEALDNIEIVMRYCDDVLNNRYGVDTNAPEMLAALREENYRESARQMAHVFGTGGFVGEA